MTFWQRPEQYIPTNEIVPRIAATAARRMSVIQQPVNTSCEELADLQIVPISERDETQEEFEIRKQAEHRSP